MASSYSTDLKLELMVTGENAGTWGQKTNNNLDLIQQAIAGFESIALSDGGTVALAMSDAAESNARNMVLKFTGTLTTASTVTIPDGIEKFYIIDLSAVTGVTNLTIKTVSGTGFTAGEAAVVAAYSDGTNLNEIALNTLGGTIATAQIDDAAISTAKLSDNAVTTAKISNLNVTTAKIADNAITSAKISALQVTQAKIANDAVGPDQLANTAVTPGEYATATITVDAQGRITAAAAGSSGSTLFADLTQTFTGPTSGNFAAKTTTNTLAMYLGGGGGGGAGSGDNFTGRGGGSGGFGFVTIPVSAPYNSPYTVGGGGNAGPPGNGSSGGGGGNTSLSSYNANGGGGGNRTGPSDGNKGSTGNMYYDFTPFSPNGNRGGNSGPFTNPLNSWSAGPSENNIDGYILINPALTPGWSSAISDMGANTTGGGGGRNNGGGQPGRPGRIIIFESEV
jgi:hypothetical protein